MLKAIKVCAEIILVLGALACIFVWLGIKPGDLRMTSTWPHWAWLICGLLLFAISLWLSGYSLYVSTRKHKAEIAAINEQHRRNEETAEVRHNSDVSRAQEIGRQYKEEKHQAVEEIRKLKSDLAEEQRAFQKMVVAKDSDYGARLHAKDEECRQLAAKIETLEQELLRPQNLLATPVLKGVFDEPTIGDSDPRIYVEIVDRRFGGDTLRPSDAKVVLSLINRGGSEATNIHVNDIQLRREKIAFEGAPSVIAVKESGTASPVLRDGDRGIMQQHDLTTAFFAEWDSYHNLKREEETASLVVTYCDFNSNVIQTTCELVFSPYIEGNIAHGLSHGQSSFSTRNFKFERIAMRLP